MIRHCLIIALLLPAGAALGTDCQPQAGFDLALAGQAETPPCEGRAYRIDFELGRNLRLLQQERADLVAALEKADSEDSDRRKLRLQVLERELQQLEGLARIRGLLAP
ncbi:MAG: hypothetical protein V2J42_04680 [Wenzhouxiangella sp.]|jgi:hypothetical protein|nr:hypothetical protein [Wenzhouxiangella sp.]